MSYDLYFTDPRINRTQFREYFTHRKHYEVSDSQACYQNEDTGVYFLIDHNEGEEEDPEAISSTASLSLNYYRPHIFGLEAADEIAAFIEHFGFSIHDPQNEGMGDGPFSKEGFLRAWNHGNEFGYSAVLLGDNPPETVWSLPGGHLEKIWAWNYRKALVQESFGEDIFVPRVFFMMVAGQVVSAAVWPDAISELIPQVDCLFVGRDELAPRTLFGGRKKDRILLPFSELLSDLEPYETLKYSLPAYQVSAPRAPEHLRKRIRNLKSNDLVGEGIAIDRLLNAEIVSKIKNG